MIQETLQTLIFPHTLFPVDTPKNCEVIDIIATGLFLPHVLMAKWKFPEVGAPSVIIHFKMGFSIINKHFGIHTMLVNPQISVAYRSIYSLKGPSFDAGGRLVESRKL